MMKQRHYSIFLAALCCVSFLMITSCSREDNPANPSGELAGRTIRYRFASKAEGQRLVQANTDYYNSLTQLDLEWKSRKENATRDDAMAYARQQVLDFTAAERSAVADAIREIEDSLAKRGCQLPLPDEIVIVKTTMLEEGDAGAYTHKNQLFLSEIFFDVLFSDEPDDEIDDPWQFFKEVVAHEVFHIASRHSPEFRRQMYALIGFTILPEEIQFPDSIRRRIMANPDVERMDNYAEFTIEGRKRQCEIVILQTHSWAEGFAIDGKYASFFDYTETYLIPLDDLSQKYLITDATDFWDKMGRNTEYIIAAEECLADNFSFAVMSDPKAESYETPELISSILKTLRNFPARP